MSGIATAIIGGAVVGGVASSMAAGKQADATENAANISKDASMYAADVQKQQYDQTRADQTPWRDAGVNALGKLSGQLDQFNKPYSGSAPTPYAQATPTPYGVAAPEAYVRAAPKSFTMADYQADPGYQFRLDQGMKALQNSAAARGGLLSGNTLKGTTDYAQGAASQEYQNAYTRYIQNQDRADQVGQSNYNNQVGAYQIGLNNYNQNQQYTGQVGQQNYTNALNAYNQDRGYYNADQTNNFNRIATVAGVGQTANNALATAGQNYAGNVGNITMANATNQGNAAIVGGNAQAGAYQGWGNALGTAAQTYGYMNAMTPNNASSFSSGNALNQPAWNDLQSSYSFN